MAIGFDATATTSAALYNATFTWTHTPAGTPRGVAVIVVQEGSTDQVSGVTYGGVAMTRVRSNVRTATEAGRVYIYFLGSGLPAGAQTVQVTLTGTLDTNAASLTVTAAANTLVDVSEGLDAGIIANPSLSISPTVAAEIFYGIFSGLAAPVTTVQTGSTHVIGRDYGTDSAMWARKSVSAGATTIGYTAASDDVCHSALAIKEWTAQTFYTTIAPILTGVAVLGTISTRYITIAPILVGVMALEYGKKLLRTIAAVVTGVAALTKVPTYVQTIAATVTGVVVLSKVATFYRTVAATVTGVAVLTKGMFQTVAATVTGNVAVSTIYTGARTIAATVAGIAGLTKQFIASGGAGFVRSLARWAARTVRR